ncbi:MAG: hypothetical protein LBB14_01360, partial [Puniceicoccales bacterium]|nr:hypothetical protein [Puniceicoccales bacterium]
MSDASFKPSLATVALGGRPFIAQVAELTGVTAAAATRLVQTMADKPMAVNSVPYHVQQILHPQAAVLALFYILCFITLGIYLLHSLVTYRKPLDLLAQSAVEEFREDKHSTDQLAEAQISAAAADIFGLPAGEDIEEVGKAFCAQVIEKTRTAPLALSGCKILGADDSADFAADLAGAAEKLQVALGIEKNDGAEEYPFQLRKNLPHTKETANRWNELVDLLDRYGQLRRAEVELAEAKKTFEAQKITTEYRKELSDAVKGAFRKIDALWDNGYHANLALEMNKLREEGNASIKCFTNAAKPFKKFFKDIADPASILGGKHKADTAGFDAVAVSLHVHSFLIKVVILLNSPAILDEHSIPSYPFSTKIADLLQKDKFAKCTVVEVRSIILASISGGFSMGDGFKGDGLIKNGGITQQEWDDLCDGFFALEGEIVRIFREGKIYGGLTGLEVAKNAQEKFERERYERSSVPQLKKKVEMLRISWEPKPTEKPENGEKLLVRSARGIFEQFSTGTKLSDGTETKDPAPFLADKLRQGAKSGKPIRIDPTTKDLAGELNSKLGLSGDSALACSPFVPTTYTREIQNFIAEFNRYGELLLREMALHESALDQISKSLAAPANAGKDSPFDAFLKDEGDGNRGRSALARIRSWGIPFPYHEGKEPAKGLLRIGDVSSLLGSWKREYEKDLRESLLPKGQLFRTENFPKYGKTTP